MKVNFQRDEYWSNFFKNNINYDVAAIHGAPAGVYNVKVRFTVFEDGRVGDISALTNYGYGMENEVVKVSKKAPIWRPPSQASKSVKYVRSQTVTFVVKAL